MPHPLLLCLALQAGAHESLHPAYADLYLESPDVAAALGAYGDAPMVRMFRDDEALGALRTMLGMPELAGRDLLEAGLELLPLPPELTENALAMLPEVSSASFSLVGRGGGHEPGALAVVDWKSPEAARDLATALDAALSERESAWGALEGARVVVGAGSVTPEVWAGLKGGSVPALASDEALGADARKLEAGAGVPIVHGFHRRQPLDLLLDVVPASVASSLAPMKAVGDALFGPGAMHWRMSLADGRFRTNTYQPGLARPIAGLDWLGGAPLDPGILSEVHPGALLVVAASLDGDGVRRSVDAWLGDEGVGSQSLENLGPNAALFIQPVKGIGLPKGFLVLELRESDGALERLTAFVESLAANVEGFRSKASKYKGVPYVTLTLPPELASLGDMGTLRPTMSVLDGKLFVTNGSLTLKKEIRRRLGDEKEQLPPADYPWTRSSEAIPAGTTAAFFVDWGAQVEGLLTVARTFGPMLSSFAGDLPFDLTNLPQPNVFTDFMPPTVHTIHPGPEGGQLARHEAGFALETWLGLAGLGSVVTDVMTAASAPAAVPALESVEVQDPQATTIGTLRELRTGLTVFKIDRGTFPADLAHLTEPTANYPNGYLDGAATLPVDAWGHAFRYERDEATYRLWSPGPDGVDQDGAGDDVQDL